MTTLICMVSPDVGLNTPANEFWQVILLPGEIADEMGHVITPVAEVEESVK
jgi:hypothetical protein